VLRLVLLAALTGLALALAGVTSAAPAAAKPNILFIVTDDQSPKETIDVMPRTREWFETGNTAQGIEGGTYFPNAVVTTPLCCPSRASMISGRYAHHHGIITTPFGAPGMTQLLNFRHDLTLEAYLKADNYRTAAFGKLLNAWPLEVDPPYFDDFWVLREAGYSGVPVTERFGDAPSERKYVFRYTPNTLTAEAERFLDDAEQRDDSQPWFMWLAPPTPHGPFFPEPQFESASVPALDEQDPAYKAFYEPDRSDKPMFIRGRTGDPELTKALHDEQLRMLKSADSLVDGVMRKVETLGEDQGDGTLAFFVSDNGFLLGEHGLEAKGEVGGGGYLEAIGVPFYMRWPGHGVASGQTDDRLAANIDMAPTALSAAGLSPSAGEPMDGRSLLPSDQMDRNEIFTEYPCGSGPPASAVRDFHAGEIPSWASIKTRSFHYIEYYRTYHGAPTTATCNLGNLNYNPQTGTGHVDYGDVIAREYYDIRPGHDPAEEDNLLDGLDSNQNAYGDGDPTNDPPTGLLSSELSAHRQCSGISGAGSCDRTLGVQAAVTSGPTGGSTSAAGSDDATFTFTSSEPGSTFHCSVDGVSPPGGVCASPYTYQRRLAPGKHRLLMYAKAPSGKRSARVEYEWYSGPNPDTEITANPRALSKDQVAQFRFASPDTIRFDCTLDGGAPQACDRGSFDTPQLADGQHTFTVRAKSGSREDPTPASYSWKLDGTAPETAIGIKPDSETSATSARFSLISTSPESRALDDERDHQFECSLQGPGPDQPFATCGDGNAASGSAFKEYRRLTAGQYTFSVRSIDQAGNVDPSPATYQWTVGVADPGAGNPLEVKTFSDASDPGWPDVDEGASVRAIEPDGSGGWYVGGDFAKVGGLDRTDLVHIKSDKTVDLEWMPQTNGIVRTMVLDQGRLYIGGTFTEVTNTTAADDPCTPAVDPTLVATRNNLAALDATTGNVIASCWDPSTDDGNGSTDDSINALALGPPAFGLAASLYAGGTFRQVDGDVSHRRVVEIGLASGAPTGWTPNWMSGTVHALAVNERYVYLGGSNLRFTSGAPLRAILELDRLSNGAETEWNANAYYEVSPGNKVLGTVFSLALANDLGGPPTIYLGGTFSEVRYTPDGGSPVTTPRSAAAEVNLSDLGSPTPWDPALGPSNSNVRALVPFHCTSQAWPSCTAIIGGTFGSVKAGGANERQRARLAETDRSAEDPSGDPTGAANDWDPGLDAAPLAIECQSSPAPNQDIFKTPNRCDTNANRVLAVGGNFTTVGGGSRPRLAFFGAAPSVP
jgi:arylsulfatase A-like enzyme